VPVRSDSPIDRTGRQVFVSNTKPRSLLHLAWSSRFTAIAHQVFAPGVLVSRRRLLSRRTWDALPAAQSSRAPPRCCCSRQGPGAAGGGGRTGRAGRSRGGYPADATLPPSAARTAPWLLRNCLIKLGTTGRTTRLSMLSPAS
jgi:hypothetical protein